MGKGGKHWGILVPGTSVTAIKGSGTYINVLLCQFDCCDLFQLAEVSLILVHTSGHTRYCIRMVCSFYATVSCALA
jgi:hypothetical protein